MFYLRFVPSSLQQLEKQHGVRIVSSRTYETFRTRGPTSNNLGAFHCRQQTKRGASAPTKAAMAVVEQLW